MTLFTFRRTSTMIRPATTRVILGVDSSNSLQEVSFVKSTAVTDTDVSIERVNLAFYDSYVVTGPCMGGPSWTSYGNGCFMRPTVRASPLHERWVRTRLSGKAQSSNATFLRPCTH